jgi:hypothetical protein
MGWTLVVKSANGMVALRDDCLEMLKAVATVGSSACEKDEMKVGKLAERKASWLEIQLANQTVHPKEKKLVE